MLETINSSSLPLTGTTTSASSSSESGILGQQDFLTLLTTQMQNQDPLQPMENGEFLAQMAQFSTVAGIDRVNDTLTNLTDGMRDFRMATATNLLGHQVLVPSNIARPDDQGAISGVIDLPEDAENVILSYTDPASGELLYTENLGARSAGLIGFNWQDIPQEMVDSRAPIRVNATVVTENGAVEIGSSVYARVISARTDGYASDNVTLEIEDYGAMNALEVEAFR